MHSAEDNFCPGCGQKNNSSRLKISELLEELSSSLFNVDARLITTIRDLWNPGVLSREYFKGKRKKYIPPVRLFLFSLLFLLLAFSFIFSDINSRDDDSFYSATQKQVYTTETVQSADSLYRRYQAGQNPERSHLLDSFHMTLLKQHGLIPDSLTRIPDSIPALSEDSVGFALGNALFQISNRDMVHLTSKELVDKYDKKSLWKNLVLEQYVKAFKYPRALLYYLIGSISYIYILLIPVISFFLWLLYIRSDKYYIEHLIFSLHLQSVVSVLFGLALFTQVWIEDWAYIITLIPGFIYLVLAFKRYYQQGWLKTSLKIFLIGSIYSTALLFLILSVLIARFLLF